MDMKNEQTSWNTQMFDHHAEHRARQDDQADGPENRADENLAR